MSHDELAIIADLYIPLLVLITVRWFLYAFFQIPAPDRCYKKAMRNVSATIMGMLVIYTFMFVDMQLNIFVTIGLDYSTHTALALVFIVTLSFVNKQVRWIAISSMILYCLLMIYQKYHSFYDIIATAILVLPPLIGLTYLSNKKMLTQEINDD